MTSEEIKEADENGETQESASICSYIWYLICSFSFQKMKTWQITIMVAFFLFVASAYERFGVAYIKDSWLFIPVTIQVAILLALPTYYLLGRFLKYHINPKNEHSEGMIFGIFITGIQLVTYLIWFFQI